MGEREIAQRVSANIPCAALISAHTVRALVTSNIQPGYRNSVSHVRRENGACGTESLELSIRNSLRPGIYAGYGGNHCFFVSRFMGHSRKAL